MDMDPYQSVSDLVVLQNNKMQTSQSNFKIDNFDDKQCFSDYLQIDLLFSSLLTMTVGISCSLISRNLFHS